MTPPPPTAQNGEILGKTPKANGATERRRMKTEQKMKMILVSAPLPSRLIMSAPQIHRYRFLHVKLLIIRVSLLASARYH